MPYPIFKMLENFAIKPWECSVSNPTLWE